MKTKIAILFLITINVSIVFSQCNCASPVSTFPATMNGITVNVVNSGDVQIYSSPWSNCGITAAANWVGQHTSFSQTYSFSSPVNNVRVVLTAVDTTENFSFSVNSGVLTTALCSAGCPNFSKTGNTFKCTNPSAATFASIQAETSAGRGWCAPSFGGGSSNPPVDYNNLIINPNYTEAASAIILLTSSTPFTSFTMSGTGGDCPWRSVTNGSIAGLCVESLCLPPTINIASISSSAICNGQSTTITPGGASTYTLTPGNLTGSSFVVSPSATTTYTISGGNSGCTSTTAGNAVFTINVNPTPVLSISTSASTICSGQTATLTVSGASTYTWSNGGNATTNIVTPLVSTTYSVIGTNSFGCSNSSVPKTQLVTVNATPTVAIASLSSATLCNGSSATITASGASNYTLTGGSTNLTSNPFVVSPTSNTNYTLTGASVAGCLSGNTVNTSITVYGSPTIAVSVSNNTLCVGQSSTITANGAVAGNYTLMPSGTTTEPFIVSPTSTTNYTINGTSVNGCPSNSSTQAGALVVVNSIPTISITSQKNVLCFGSATGSLTLSTVGGTGLSTITPATFNNLIAGNYTCTTIDDLGCNSTTVIAITEPAAALASSNATVSANTNCVLHDGVATVTVTGGTPSYTVNWSSGATGLTASNLNTGLSTYTIIDANGCIDNTGSLTLDGILGISTSAVSQSFIGCFNDATGAISFTTSGGGIINYTLSNVANSTSSISATGVFTNLSAGNYSLYVVGIGGCNTSQLFSINQPTSAINIVSISSNSIACFGGTVAITASVNGGTPPYSYTWQANSATTQVANYATGTYSMAVTDINNCYVAPQSFTVTQPTSSVSISSIPATSVACFGNATSITANANGGTGAYTYNWQSNSSSNNTATYTAGNYTVQAIDANNCLSLPTAFSITQPTNALTIAVLSLSNTCINQSNGAVVVGITGGTPSYTILWSNGVSSNTLSGLPLGIITGTVTDANFCINTASISIDVVKCVELLIANMFTPNGDGQNDLFVINAIFE